MIMFIISVELQILENPLNPIETISTNVLGTSYILESCKNHNIKKFIFHHQYMYLVDLVVFTAFLREHVKT